MFPPNQKKTPTHLPTCKGAGSSLQKEPVLLHCLAVPRGLLPWHPLGRASDRWKGAPRHGGVLRREQPAVSIKGKTSPLVCVPADSQRVSLCLSAVTSAFLSPTYPGAHSQPPRRAGAPPQRSQGRLERRERGREQQHFQDEQECAPRRAALASSLILYS